LVRLVERVDRPRTLRRRRRLADGFGSLDRDRSQASEQLIELVVDDAAAVAGCVKRDAQLVYLTGTTPCGTQIRQLMSYRNDAV
jgi:hypothetical protein